jgi:hypothetical protein
MRGSENTNVIMGRKRGDERKKEHECHNGKKERR